MISVVIPAFNEELTIPNCLVAFVNQNTEEMFEVIVVDNCSTDKTAEVALAFKNRLNLKVIFEKKKGRGAARAKGFKSARGEIIFSTDADTVAPSNWIEKFTGKLDKNTGAVTGTCKINDCGVITNVLFNLFQPISMRIYSLFFGHYWLSGFSFAIYKDIYEKSGGFNENLNGQEDIDLSFKVSKISKIEFISNLPVIFSGRRFKNGLLKGLFPYVKTFISVFINKKEDSILSDLR